MCVCTARQLYVRRRLEQGKDNSRPIRVSLYIRIYIYYIYVLNTVIPSQSARETSHRQ